MSFPDQTKLKKRYPIITYYIPPHKRNVLSKDLDCLTDLKKQYHENKKPLFSSFDNILTIHNSKNRNMPKIPHEVETPNKLSSIIHQRILKLANVYLNTDFKKDLLSIYLKEYQENLLPADCIKTLKFSVILDTNIESSKKLISNIEKISYKNELKHNDVLNQLTVMEPDVIKLENLKDEFCVAVYSCNSIADIWGVILDTGHYDKVEELAEEMAKFYEKQHFSPVIAQKNAFYAICDDSYHRVKCLNVKDSLVTVFFIDRGDQDTFPVHELLFLDKKFYSLPAQAIKMSLSGLEMFSDLSYMNEILEKLILNKNVFVKINHRDFKNKILSVQLHFSECGNIIDVNNVITNLIIEKDLDPKTFVQPNVPIEGRISHISKTGIFIVLHTKSLDFFEVLMKETRERVLKDESLKKENVTAFNVNSIYLVFNSEDENWYRATILKFINFNKIEVFLVDVGLIISVARVDFILLEDVSSALAKYPYQAIQVKLDQLSYLSSKQQDKLRELTDDAETLYFKFNENLFYNNDIPAVQFLKKTTDNTFISINDALLQQKTGNNTKRDIFSKLDKNSNEIINLTDGNWKRTVEIVPYNASLPEESLKKIEKIKINLKFENTIKKIDTSNMSSKLESKIITKTDSKQNIFYECDQQNLCLSDVLDSPNIPLYNYFDVHVLFAFDPSHFVIQLLHSKYVELVKLNDEMSKIYNSYNGPKTTVESIKIGHLYAGKSSTNNNEWRRYYLLKKVNLQTVLAYSCDYGIREEIDISNLIPLDKKFSKLPYQAIWCELNSMKSKLNSWTKENCIKFKNLVQSKNFVCVVRDKKDALITSDEKIIPTIIQTNYVVDLIDTSTEDDIYINDLLIKEN